MRHHFSQTTGPRRLAYAALAGGVVACLPLPVDWPARALMVWIVAASVDLGLAAWLASGFGTGQIRERAKSQDESAWVIFLLMVVAVCASVAAIVLMIRQARSLPPDERALQVALAVLALAASWLWIHTLFAFHYAHRYYQCEIDDDPRNKDGGGLDFPGEADPDYYDFLYFSLVIGMTSQVSDVDCTSRTMRRLAMVHGLLAFVFNVVVLALGINTVAGTFQ